MLLADLCVNSHSRQNEDHQEKQRRFAASQQRRARVAGTLRAHVIHQLGDAPQNDQDRPKAPKKAPDPEVRMEAGEKKQHSEDDQEQATEDGTALRSAVAHARLMNRDGRLWKPATALSRRHPRRSAEWARVPRS